MLPPIESTSGQDPLTFIERVRCEALRASGAIVGLAGLTAVGNALKTIVIDSAIQHEALTGPDIINIFAGYPLGSFAAFGGLVTVFENSPARHRARKYYQAKFGTRQQSDVPQDVQDVLDQSSYTKEI